jgi:hypothetical protein
MDKPAERIKEEPLPHVITVKSKAPSVTRCVHRLHIDAQ